MTVEFKYAIVIATVSDWLKSLAPVFRQTTSHLVRAIFPAL